MSEHTEYTWSSQADWDSAERREGVVTRNIGPRDRHDLRLGLDPEWGVVSEALHYWPLDDDPTAEDNYTDDVIGGADAIYKNDPDPAPSGAAGSNAPDFDGQNTAVGFGSTPDFDHGGIFSFFCVFEHDDSRNHRCIFHTARPYDAEGAILISKNDNDRISVGFIDSNGEWQFSDFMHEGDVTPNEPHTLFVSFRNMAGADWRMDVWLDGERETNVVNTWRPGLAQNNNYGAIGSVWYDEVRWFDAIMDEVVYWDEDYNGDAAEQLHRAFTDGYLQVGWFQNTDRAEQLDASATIPDGTTITAVVEQGRDEIDRTLRVPLDDGTHSYDLHGFTPYEDGWYRMRLELQTESYYDTPILHDVTLTTRPVDTAIWDSADNGVVQTHGNGVIETV